MKFQIMLKPSTPKATLISLTQTSKGQNQPKNWKHMEFGKEFSFYEMNYTRLICF
jgi:hypothetical protein